MWIISYLHSGSQIRWEQFSDIVEYIIFFDSDDILVLN